MAKVPRLRLNPGIIGTTPRKVRKEKFDLDFNQVKPYHAAGEIT